MKDTSLSEKTIVVRLAEKLRKDILDKKLVTGQRITIKEVTELYDVSMTPVREAFRVLEGEGLLELNPYKGATVKNLDRNLVNNVYGMLRAIEFLIDETAMGRIDEAALDELEAINKDIDMLKDRPRDREKYLKLNSQFHEMIISYCDNIIAIEEYKRFHNIITALREKWTPSYERIRTVVSQHEDIITAMRRKDSMLLKAAVDVHINSARDNFVRQSML